MANAGMRAPKRNPFKGLTSPIEHFGWAVEAHDGRNAFTATKEHDGERLVVTARGGADTDPDIVRLALERAALEEEVRVADESVRETWLARLADKEREIIAGKMLRGLAAGGPLDHAIVRLAQAGATPAQIAEVLAPEKDGE